MRVGTIESTDREAEFEGVVSRQVRETYSGIEVVMTKLGEVDGEGRGIDEVLDNRFRSHVQFGRRGRTGVERPEGCMGREQRESGLT